MKRVLIANRGEIAIRIMNAAHDLEIETVAVYTPDDAANLHIKKADQAHQLPGTGVAGYLEIEDIINIAKQTECDAIHPGYGFLSERADFAEACAQADIIFIGPSESALTSLGDKASARALAIQSGIPVAAGSNGSVNLDAALAFFDQLQPEQAMVIKAVAGGGGRGMRIVRRLGEVENAFLRCRSEAEKAFGVADLYVEELIDKARHIEVQVVADGENYSHLFERDCSLQRRNQKVIEIAPAPNLSQAIRTRLINSALTLARATDYKGVGTFEFLVFGEQQDQFVFLEVNPRLQVEHTVTEELTGIDVVQLQFQIAENIKLNTEQILESTQPPPEGYAIQLRINGESLLEDGSLLPAFGEITRFDVSMARGTRLDTHIYNGYSMSANYDSLLAKLIVKSIYPSFSKAIKTSYRNLCSISIDGVDTNIEILKNILMHPIVDQQYFYTRFIDEHI
ncbi:MAG: ATP-grasp domain-containing protein, partial [Pseudomonadales bacterium]|nr:ATP-grasp domain-containing protein [Pseudomonadales bacterium]